MAQSSVSSHSQETVSAGSPKKTSWIKKVAIGLVALWFVVCLFVWIFSPMLVRHFAAQPLQDLHISLADTSSVRFNPFTSTLTVTELALLDKAKKPVFTVGYAEVSVHLHRLLLSQLYVSEFLLSNVTVEAVKDVDNLIVAGVNLSADPQAQDDIIAEESPVENPQNDSSFKLVLPALLFENIQASALIDGTAQTVMIKTLSMLDAALSQNAQQLDLSIVAAVNEAPLTISSQLALNNLVGTVSTKLSLTGFSLASISPLLAAQGIEVLGALSVEAAPTIILSEQQIDLSNKALTVALSNLDLRTQPWLVSGVAHKISINDFLASATLDGALQSASMQINTDLQQGNVSIDNIENSLVNWQDVAITTLVSMDQLEPTVNIPTISINGLNLSQNLAVSDTPAMLALGNVALTNIDFGNNTLAVDEVALSGLVANIKVNPDKSIQSLVDTTALSPQTTEETEPAQAAKQENGPVTVQESAAQTTEQTQQTPLLIKLKSFTLADQGLVNVQDESVKPAFNQQLRIETLSAGPFDSSQANAESPFELLIADDNYLSLNVSGHVSPFAEKLNAAMNAKVAELNLPSVSPYVKDGLGFELKSGQLDVNIALNIKDDEIDGNTQLLMRGIEMSSADELEQGALKEGKAMPLNAALGVLKDDKGNIDLDVPMRGNVADPSFGVESFMGMILKKAAMSQAKDYLMTTFVPYASVVSVALSGAEYLLKITFEPLTFDVGVAELKAENDTFLAELALLMKDNEDLQVKTCAIVTYADVGLAEGVKLNDTQKAQIKALGDARQGNLKRFLVEQEIASNRVLYCAPELDTDPKAIPRIALKTD